MAEGYHYIDEEKTQIKLDTGEDVSTALVKQIHIEKPDGSETENDASVVDNNYLQYEIPILDQIGQWKAQVYVELTSGWKGHGKTVVWTVFNQYDTPD